VTCSSALWVFTFLGVISFWSVSWAGSFSSAPEPIVHDVMRDGFFVQELLDKHSALLRVGGGYPFGVWGGVIETRLHQKRSKNLMQSLKELTLDPKIDTISASLVIYFNPYILFASSLDVNPSRSEFVLKKFAIIFGEPAQSNVDTKLGALSLPFKLSLTCGQVANITYPWRSAMLGVANDMLLFTRRALEEKMLGVLIGGQKHFNNHTVSLQVMPLQWTHWLINPQWAALFKSGYAPTVGAGYDLATGKGSLYASIQKNGLKLSGQRVFSVQSSKSIWSTIKFTKAHLEFSCAFSGLKLPIEAIVGYSFLNEFTSSQENPIIAVLKVWITQHAQLKVGIKWNEVFNEAGKELGTTRYFMIRLNLFL
jgi:hypothetical protein